MTFLNLLLLPLLLSRLLFKTDGGGTGDAGDPPADDSKTTGNDGAKPSDKPDAKQDEPLGEAGTKALEAFKERARNAEREAKAAKDELDALKQANQSESEKAITAAKKEAAAEERTKWQGVIRQAKVESALTAAGCNDPAIAALAREFAELTVSDEGDIENLTATVETFKKSHPTLFTARVAGGSADQGAKPNSPNRPATLEGALDAHYAGSRAAS